MTEYIKGFNRRLDIEEIIEELKTLWLKYPNQRLGQVLENYVFTKGKRGDLTSIKLFFQKDEDTLQQLKEENHMYFLLHKNRK